MTKLVGSFLLVALIISSAAGISDYYRNIPGNHNKKEAASHTNMHFASDKKITSSVLTRSNFEDSIKTLYNTIGLKAYDMNYAVFRYGMIGYHALKQEGKLNSKSLVSFIDFTKKSTEKRFYTIDLKTHKVKYHSLVSHGRNTGEDEAKKFSNILHSNQSSLGFYVTGETYVGSKGYSLRLDGVEGKFNSNMRKRAVVMHEAAYVSEDWIKRYGRLGRSQGCPALPKSISKEVINTIKDKTMIFAYFEDPAYLASSTYLKIDKLFNKLEVAPTVTASL